MSLVVFALLKLFSNIPIFAGQEDLFRIVIAYAVFAVIGIIGIFAFKLDMPRSYYVVGWIFSFITTVCVHFGRRIILGIKRVFSNRSDKDSKEKIMVIGAGYDRRMLMREYDESDKLNGKIVCFIDDNVQKHGCLWGSIPVVGGRDQIVQPSVKYDVDKIIFAIPSSDGKTRKEILDICCETHCKVEVVPGIYQLVNGQVVGSKLCKVQI